MLEILSVGNSFKSNIPPIGFLTVFITGCFTILGWFVNRLIKGIDDKLKNICDNQKRCQLELPEKYVLKKDCEREMGRLEHNIIESKGNSNGKGLHHAYTD